MFLKLPKDKEIFWTKHSKMKMRQYRLSEKRVLRILRKPDRKEEGIAEGTIASMQISGTKKHPNEVWTMYQILKKPPKAVGRRKFTFFSPLRCGSRGRSSLRDTTRQAKGIRIISAWRYPGRSPLGKPPPIPDDVFEELEKFTD